MTTKLVDTTDIIAAVKILSRMGTMAVAARNTSVMSGKHCVLVSKHGYSEAKKEEILAAYHKRPSIRGIQRIFGISPQTLASPRMFSDWMAQKDRQTLTVDRHVSADETNCGFCDRHRSDGEPLSFQNIQGLPRHLQGYRIIWETFDYGSPSQLPAIGISPSTPKVNTMSA
jgi:hypothetical protein